MFFGEYRHQIDEKGRIRIPPKLKAQLGERPFITRSSSTSVHKCVIVLPAEDAAKIFDAEFGTLSALTDDSKSVRVMASSGFVAEEDKAGRILLPQRLIEHAGLHKNAVTIGAYNRVEIWSEESWDAYIRANAEEENDPAPSEA